MRLKTISLVVMTLLSVTQASAQWKIGVQGGYTENMLMVSKSYDYDRHYIGAGGFILGIPVRYEFNNWFGLQAEASYITKNYSMKRSNAFRLNQYNYTNSFFEVPVFARFSFGGDRLHGYLLTGGYIGAWLRSNVEGNQSRYFNYDYESETSLDAIGAYHFDEKVPFDSRRDNRFDAGMVGAVGLEYGFAKRFSVFAEGRFYYSLTDMQKDYMLRRPSKHNSTFAFMAGVTYTISTR